MTVQQEIEANIVSRSTSSLKEMADEIDLLRRALLDALVVFDIGIETKFRDAYSDVIKRAQATAS